MTVRPHYGVFGLVTDPNRLDKPVDGALSVARECVIRRAGYIEPRPGFPIEDDDPSPLSDLKALIPFGGDVLHIGSDVTGDGDPYNAYWPIADDVVRDGDADVLLWNDGARRGVETRGNLYLTTADGVRRLMSATDTDALLAGLVPPLLLYAEEDGTDALLADGESVAYRATLEAKLSNGLVIKSAPSGRVVYTNDAGGVRNPIVYAAGIVPDIPGATVTLKVYRSYITTSPSPADEMFLMDAVEVAAGTFTSGHEDLIPNLFLGEALYTNSKQEGVRRSNMRPPACKDMALYQRSLFYANITRQARLLLEWAEGGDLSGVADGIGTRTYDGTRTNGSASISGLSSVVGLRTGMVLLDATDWGGTDPVYIISVGVSSVTMSEDWGGATDGAPASITFADTLWVLPIGEAGTLVDAAHAYIVGNDVSLLSGLYVGNGLARITPSTLAFGLGVSEVSRREGTTYAAPTGPRGMFLEAYKATQTLHVFATNGASYTPELPEWNDTVIVGVGVPAEISGPPGGELPLAVEPEHLPNYIGWSKADEPEHHVLGAIEGVGHQKNPLARIVAARNALWIFKTVEGDGFYRLSGFGERSGWRIDKIDTDSYLLSPDLLTAHKDIVYGWTDTGLAAVSDAGPIQISAPLIGSETSTVERWITPETVGGFAVTNSKDNEVIFGLPADPESADDCAEVVYVYNVKTGAFTTWFHENPRTYCCATYANGLLLFGTTEDGWARIEHETLRLDGATLVTISTVDADTGEITIAGGSNYDPIVGDFLLSTGSAFITAVASPTEFTVDDVTGFVAGAAFAFEGYESVISWLPKTTEGASVSKRFRELIVHWDSREGVGYWDLDLESTIGGGNSGTQSYANNQSHDLTIPADQRCMIGRANALASRLAPTITIRQARSKWRLSGLTVVSDPLTAKGSVHR